MGLNFRKSFKIAPGVRVNIGKQGISSISVGGRSARVTIGNKKTTTTVGIPNSGLSYSTSKHHRRRQSPNNLSTPQSYTNTHHYIADQSPKRQLSVLLLIGIILMPYIFVWFTLRKGYSLLTRVLCFGWLFLFFYLS